jgi:hypothetical protein
MILWFSTQTPQSFSVFAKLLSFSVFATAFFAPISDVVFRLRHGVIAPISPTNLASRLLAAPTSFSSRDCDVISPSRLHEFQPFSPVRRHFSGYLQQIRTAF